ncbi:MarR family winged helix-turn-helix transcriptional regulator [Deinococcus sp. KNUC1210]|uniref:MarR family winged helix-turn-helix transcriptional regulator n=1 Tax=Deinococcus sp. KNUC1210 TaxID=2917691 RepID=UPI0027145EC9|nr:MarR family transcriptional regulator [Deinococcus sp. KNUC1210]
MKDSETETEISQGPSPGAPPTRQQILEDIFELQMGLMVLGQKSVSGMLARYDLHLTHMLVLNGLAGMQPGLPTAAQGQSGQRIALSMSDISRALDMPPASATAMIDRLTARNLVERTPSPQDRRMVLVALTDDGRELTRQFQQHWKQLQLDAYDVISDEHLQDHLHLMQRLHQQYLIRAGAPDNRMPAPPLPEDSP